MDLLNTNFLKRALRRSHPRRQCRQAAGVSKRDYQQKEASVLRKVQSPTLRYYLVDNLPVQRLQNKFVELVKPFFIRCLALCAIDAGTVDDRIV